MRQLIVIFLCAWLGGFELYPYSSAGMQDDIVSELLRNRIETSGSPSSIRIGEEIIHASIMLPQFYQRRIYKTAWSNKTHLLPQTDQLLATIRAANLEGLNPDDYHLTKILQLLQMIGWDRKNKTTSDPYLLVDLDLLLTDAFLIYGTHLLAGKVNPERIEADWIAARKELDLALVLESALERNQVAQDLKGLLPRHPSYWHLRNALVRYKAIAVKEDLPMLNAGPKLSRGDDDQRISVLFQRLLAFGDVDPDSNPDTGIFDEKLEQAVLRFQKRHGLYTDGIVGPSTLAALNVSLQKRVRQIELNMDRWRWLPQEFGARYILVNIADFELSLIEDAKKIMTMKVVVGKQYRRTPVFSSRMTYLVLSPNWHIPLRLAVQDKLPLIQKDINFFEKQKIRVFQGWGAETKEIEPRNIDWSQVTEKSFNFRLRQDPGPLNALGRVKFMFPNKFDVYLHDTPEIGLFAKTERTFSSGCIRIEKPIDLTEHLLSSDAKWTRDAILSAINKGEEQTVGLPEPIDVNLLYCTAWADENGTIFFRKDIYGRDKRLEEALIGKKLDLSKRN